ncbi:hypothetical protein DAPPUDRAFT_263275 [Daphnia pulex]|uniref:Uncharacterized protein n=1 Tax=Daphnia pulex TaxID=6669 RepID=E9HPG0_DAPPU|nr:hypothetical protein DAPPUDRAFT_263275 [Daphnia pulex]|eukprot:EFX66377.1 hypothetical protein DAPPUDRAFT_263275 [Daphnia pulex]
MAPKKVNSDAVKLRMQQKADAKLIAHHKAINKHWKGVSYWTDVEEDNQENDDENQETQYREYSYEFTPEKPVGPKRQINGSETPGITLKRAIHHLGDLEADQKGGSLAKCFLEV